MSSRHVDNGPREDESAQSARNMGEFLQELRVAQAGVQILFAFLLAVTFSARFAQATALQRTTLIVTILLTTVSAALLIAPMVWHRLVLPAGQTRGHHPMGQPLRARRCAPARAGHGRRRVGHHGVGRRQRGRDRVRLRRGNRVRRGVAGPTGEIPEWTAHDRVMRPAGQLLAADLR
jgi:hypothetical protein